MPREIKFRAFSTAHPENGVFTVENDYYTGDILGDKSFIIMQFTGLLDINGKEIYEGDIIESNAISDDYATIEWSTKYTGFALVGNSSTDPLLPSVDSKIEIIGNIYENKNLLIGYERWIP